MPRPPNPDVRRRLLAAGLDLVHARGFAASGVKDITDAAGVPKGSFYAYFPSKEAFAAAILDHYWADIEARLLPILEARRPGARTDHALLPCARRRTRGRQLPARLPGRQPVARARRFERTGSRRTRPHPRPLGRCPRGMRALRPGRRRTFRPDLDAGELASSLIEAWEGAALRGKVTRSRDPYDRFEAVTVPALLR